ncbi:hypothetical protein PXC01_18325 [Maribacter sp. M208]|uniref:hypothetical protein n=1 Tax=Maribacter huludaoensis TaxID=3030010 RepID=UPI0023EDC8EC|nr:hypothetical protein [Maribacter huludaoensis]MDF4223559.1 hypothetical protein [Maribacter huludaoensis]
MNPEDYIKWIQLIINAFALGAAGWIYRAYILNLKASISAKDEQVKIVEKNLNLWKDRVSELERKTPEFMENALNQRIKIREDEIERLSSDKDYHEDEHSRKSAELEILKSELEKAKEMQTSLSFVGEDFEEYLFERDGKMEVEKAGYVNVASGQLLITDPIFIDEDWQKEKFEDLRIYKDIETQHIYQYQKDFNNYENIITGFDKTVNQLVESKRFVPVKIERDLNYSFAGSCYATMNENGYGELQYSKGGDCAGVSLNTAFGDGIFPVYIEKYDGRNIRAYINLI